MIHSKNHSVCQGQTFIEVVLTVYMVGSLLSAILLLQSSVFSHVTTAVSRVSRMLLIEQYLYEIGLDKKLKKESLLKKTIQNPPTTLTYTEVKPQKESQLHAFKNSVLVQCEATWNQVNRSMHETVFVIRYKKPKDAA